MLAIEGEISKVIALQRELIRDVETIERDGEAARTTGSFSERCFQPMSELTKVPRSSHGSEHWSQREFDVYPPPPLNSQSKKYTEPKTKSRFDAEFKNLKLTQPPNSLPHKHLSKQERRAKLLAKDCDPAPVEAANQHFDRSKWLPELDDEELAYAKLPDSLKALNFKLQYHQSKLKENSCFSDEIRAS